LEQELAIVDQQIAEAQREYSSNQETEMYLARTVLEEQWNEQAQALMELSGKLWATEGLLGGEHLSLMKLVLPKKAKTSTAGTGANCWSDPANTACKTSFHCNSLNHRNSLRR
jgi:hypothetical protein